MKTLLFALLLGSFSTMALADQCSLVSKETAKVAVRTLMDASSVSFLCEPCGDTEATSLKAESIGLKKSSVEDYYEVVVDGKTVDLAYTYVNGLNLSKLTSCPSQLVSPSILK